jgi:hypothetical protein
MPLFVIMIIIIVVVVVSIISIIITTTTTAITTLCSGSTSSGNATEVACRQQNLCNIASAAVTTLSHAARVLNAAADILMLHSMFTAIPVTFDDLATSG